MAKTTKPFQDGLTILSLWGFAIIALNAFTEIDLSPWQTAIFLTVAGAILFIEGDGFRIRRWSGDGIQANEVSKLTTIIVGLFSVVVGILALPFINITSPTLENFTGIVAIIAFAFIALQRWVWD